MKLKSFAIWLLAVILLVSLAFVGCQTGSGNNSDTSPTTPDTPVDSPVQDPSGGDTPVDPPVQDPTKDETFATKYEHISISEARTLATEAGEAGTAIEYTIVGVVVTVSNATYGEMTVSDSTGNLYVYGSMAPDGTYYDSMTAKPVSGDEIVLKGVLKTYKGEPQMGTKDKKAIIVDWKTVEVEIDEKEYVSCTIEQARNAEKNAKLRFDGIVSAITYANGRIPSGVILIDETSSIYVYDRDIAQQVSVGNKIEVAGTKTYWILEDEQKHAATHGYIGACQVEDAILVSNDKQTNAFNKSWIEETTVKKLLNTEFDQNITSLVFKSIAYVKKAQNTGFVNYYIDDLDGSTGSYVYTQCNGSDFSWMDKYDGKVCEVYYTAINAKSSASGCNYRLLPIEINAITNFSYPAASVPSFAIEYGVIDLFKNRVFGADPALELPGSYSNDIIGVDDVKISYSVSNDKVASVTKTEDGYVLNLSSAGSCVVTITATFGTYTDTKEVTVELTQTTKIETPTAAEIIAKTDGEKVKLRGVVISSLVNQTGFYLGDKTGMIAVRSTKEIVSQLKPGDEIVVEGTKKHVKKDPAATTYVGQCVIDDAVVLANYYGNNKYATDYFITDKTIKDLHDLDVTVDYTNNVYVLQATVSVIKSQYYSQIKLKGADGTELSLYCSGAGQYSWLSNYADQTVTLELAVCNWNAKSYYTGCVISVTVDGVKTVNSLNFENN